MIRTATLFWVLLVAVTGVLVFTTSEKVHDARGHLQAVQRDIVKEEENLRVLKAEWSYLNRPERLEQLARAYLPMQPAGSEQLAAAVRLPGTPPVPHTAAPPVKPPPPKMLVSHAPAPADPMPVQPPKLENNSLSDPPSQSRDFSAVLGGLAGP